MDDIPSRGIFGPPASLAGKEAVSARELLCRSLPALKDNRVEAEESLAAAETVNGASPYKPGVYLMMDWVAARLNKASAALWAFLVGGQPAELAVEFDLFAVVDIDLAASLDIGTMALRACLV
jgi:hypothetical protein